MLHRDAIEAEVGEEFRHHLALRTEELVRRGVAPGEAARQARVEFGHIESHRDDARASRGLRAFEGIRFSWLDVRLGTRMLVRYPGLTVVGGLAMAFAIFAGAGTFHFINQLLDPTLPLPAGERIVGLRYWDREENEEALPLPHDLLRWRTELRSVEAIGAFQTVARNLALPGAAGEPATIARMSPVGFRVAGIPPLLGRALTEADAEPAAPSVIVVGYDLWMNRLGGDPSVLGRTLRVGDVPATIVGVMPRDFAFPKDHAAWVPLPVHGAGAHAGSGEPLRVFGRLAPGATREQAQVELNAVAARMARELPARHRHLIAEVLPYAESLSSIKVGTALRLMIYQLNVYAALFLVLVSANVALLMFARTATREREIVVRTALGASRARIVTQLFIEALVLAGLATVIGLAGTGPALAWIERTLTDLGGPQPFWFDTSLSATTAAYAALLALLSAVVAGVVPALKATGRGMRARLNQVGAGAGGLRLGGIWTGVVITQIAATVAFTGVAYVLARQATRSASLEANFPAEQYVGVRLELDRENTVQTTDTASATFMLRRAVHVRELKRRVGELPGVVGVTIAERLPLKSHATAHIEVFEAGAAPPDSAPSRHEVFPGSVDLEFFDVMQARVVAGRRFESRDARADAQTVIVSASFVDEALGGRSAVGRRIRYVNQDATEAPEPWLEIVGVVEDLTAARPQSLDLDSPPRARVYHALDETRAGALHMVAHVRGSAGEMMPVLHRMAEAVSPALQIHEPATLDRANSDLARLWRLYADIITAMSAVALFLSLAGIYAVMSFTVARRTREIGVRVALGARPARVITAIFRSPFIQVVAGVALGCLLLGALVWALTQGRATMRDSVLLLAWGTGMAAVCGLACIGPTLRALRVEPAEALSAEA